MRSRRRLLFLVIGPVLVFALAPDLARAQSDAAHLAPTMDAQSDHPDIIAKANELESALEMFRFVHDTIEYEVYWGSQKGALGALWSGSGNDLDQASLLIALLRAKGIPARYRIGMVKIDSEQLANWAGMKGEYYARHAFYKQYCNYSPAVGRCALSPPAFVMPTGASNFVLMEHAWVEVKLHDHYRGLGVAPSAATWVPLDPSWKQKMYPSTMNFDLEIGDETTAGGCAGGKLCFDYADYYSKVDARLASEIWQSNVIARLASHNPPKTLADVVYDGPIRPFDDEVLPATLPFSPETSVAPSELADLGNEWRVEVVFDMSQAYPPLCSPANCFEVVNPPTNSPRYWLPGIVGKRITLSFMPGSDEARLAFRKYGGYHSGEYTDSHNFHGTLLEHCVERPFDKECDVYPVVKIDGQPVYVFYRHFWTYTTYPVYFPGEDIGFTLGLVGELRLKVSIKTIGHNPSVGPTYEITPGEYLSVGIGIKQFGPSNIQDRVDALQALQSSLPLIQEGEDDDPNGNGVLGELLVDQGTLGVVEPCANYALSESLTTCDIALAVHPTFADKTIGELLSFATARYFQRDREEAERVHHLDQRSALFAPQSGIARSGFHFTYLFDQAVGVEPSAPVIDIRSSHTTVFPIRDDVNLTSQLVRREGRLRNHSGSALEHQVWEELLGLPFVSTVKGFQLVRERFPAKLLYEFTNPDSVANALSSFAFDPISEETINAIQSKAEAPCAEPGCASFVISPAAAVSAGVPPIEVYYAERTSASDITFEMIVEGGGQTIGGGISLTDWAGSSNTILQGFDVGLVNHTLFDELNAGFGTHGLVNEIPMADPRWRSEAQVGDPVAILSGNLQHSEKDVSIRGDGPALEFVRTYNSQEEGAGALGFGWSHNFEARIEPVQDEQEFIHLPSSATGMADWDKVAGLRSDTLDTWSKGGSGNRSITWEALPIAFTSRVQVESIVLEIAYRDKFNLVLPANLGAAVPLESPTSNSDAFERIDLIETNGNPYKGLGALTIELDNFGSGDRLYYARLRVRYKGPAVTRVDLGPPSFVSTSGATDWPSGVTPLLDGDASTCLAPLAGRAQAKIYFPPVVNGLTVFGHEIEIAVSPTPNSSGEPRSSIWRGVPSPPGSGEEFASGPMNDNDAARERFVTVDPTMFMVEATSNRPILTFEHDAGTSGGQPKAALCRIKYSALTIPEAVDFVAEDGSRERYVRTATGWSGLPGVRDELTEDAAGKFHLKRPDGRTLHFEHEGSNESFALTRIADPQGRSLLLSYDSPVGGQLVQVRDDTEVGSASGGTVLPYLEFGYEAGYLVSVNDWTGRRWEYDVDGAGHLIEARDPIQVASLQPGMTFQAGTRYRYGLSQQSEYERLIHNLTLISYSKGATATPSDNGDHTVAFEYYNSDRVASHTDSFGNRQTFLYNIQRLENQTTDARGFTTVYRHDLKGNLLQRLDPDGAVWSWEYDDKRNMIAETDPLGNVRSFREFDVRGNPRWIDDPDHVAPDFKTTEVTYDDASGAPDMVRDKRGNQRSVSFSTDGLPEQVSATIDSQANTTLVTNVYEPTSRALCGTYEAIGGGTNRVAATEYEYFEGNRDVRRVEVHEATSVGNCNSPSETLLTATDFEYDALGRRISETTMREKTPFVGSPLISVRTEYLFNDRGELERLTQPDGTRHWSIYDANGNLVEEYLEEPRPTGPARQHGRTTYEYDAIDRLIKAFDAGGGVTEFAYDAAGNRIAATDPDGHTSRVEYDAMNRPVRAIDANGAVTTTEYDLLGHVVAVMDAMGVRTTRTYDKVGTLVALKQGGNAPATRTLCYPSNTTTIGCRFADAQGRYHEVLTDPNGNSNVFAFDGLGRVVRQVDGTSEAGATDMNYYLRGSLQQVTDPEGAITSFDVDALGRVTSTKRPYMRMSGTLAQAAMMTEYDSTGNAVRITRPDGCKLFMNYDVMGRLVQRRTLKGLAATCPTDDRAINDQFGYDARGLLVAAKNANSGLLRDYDALGRLTRETDTRFGTGVAYQYSKASRLTAKVYPDGKVLHIAYDASGRPVGITDPTGDTTRYVYDAAGRRLQTRSTASRLRTELVYDAGRLDTIASFRADDTQRPLQRYPSYDDAGNRLAMQNELGTTSYTYDALHRLETTTPAGGAPVIQYEYDRAGNRLHAGQQGAGGVWTQTSIYETPATGGASHRLLEVRNAAGTPVDAFGYDANGNPTQWTHSGARSLHWDALDRLVSISGSFVGSYAYDPLGRRIEKTESGEKIRYQYDGLDVVAEYSVDAGGTNALAATYIFGPGIDEPLKIIRGTTLAAYHSDGLGSILAVSSVATFGATDLLNYRYDAFGVIEASSGTTLDNTYTYTGRELDGSGLYYYRARYYLASTGRFLSPDPIGLEGGINPYIYVGSNPVNYTDPFGLMGQSISRAAPPAAPAFQAAGSSQSGLDRLSSIIGQPDFYLRLNDLTRFRSDDPFPNNYLTDFGYPIALRGQAARETATPELRGFIDRVLPGLQAELLDRVRSNPALLEDRRALFETAIASHGPVYERAGFFQLPIDTAIGLGRIVSPGLFAGAGCCDSTRYSWSAPLQAGLMGLSYYSYQTRNVPTP